MYLCVYLWFGKQLVERSACYAQQLANNSISRAAKARNASAADNNKLPLRRK